MNAAANIQGLNMWPYLTGAVEQTPRTELFLDWWSNETVCVLHTFINSTTAQEIQRLTDLLFFSVFECRSFPAGNLNKPANYSDYTTDGAMIVWPYKWIRGFQLGMAFWTSENHPNNTDPWNTCKKRLPPGSRQPKECPPPGYVDGWPFVACYPEPCLFNIEVRDRFLALLHLGFTFSSCDLSTDPQEDPTEHVNLLEGGGTAQHQLIAAGIKARIDDELDVVDGRSRGFFQANDIGTCIQLLLYIQNKLYYVCGVTLGNL